MDLSQLVVDRSPAGIAATVGRLIRTGELRPGSRIPTVRDVAAQLHVSPATVSGAWHALSEAGLVRSRGRAGTYVLDQTSPWLPPRYQDLAASDQVPYRLDLSSGTPDPLLLPPVGAAFAHLARRTQAATTSSYLGPAVVAPLEHRLRAEWPFEPEELTVVDGAMDGVARTLEVLTGLGTRVVVEDPGFPPFFDLLDLLGAERVPVAMDDHGMRPDLLAAALGSRPAVVLLQPRAQNPTGASLTQERAGELAHVLRTHHDGRDVVVLEDDHSAGISQAAAVSLGSHLPGRVVHVRSFSKSHGPDLRIAAVGGPAPVLRKIIARRMLGPGWTSRMLQSVLLELLTDPGSRTAVTHARATYRIRQRELSRAVTAAGATLRAGDGLNMWLPVADERAALLYLAATGIRAAPGAPFSASVDGPAATGGAGAAPAPHLRVSLGPVRDAYGALATTLAAAALSTT
ncbi:aminotransferase class I/II-fold pyridoxal phosphate-dependent enzyme [Sanguibacter antarcticus]|uniref:DNA-binding transcriptional MocR family regulator n=1 Tax=Sanguibacter antarcticus TaxID=372484 RepID=A0A2A9E3S0_9MICO|nr:aminotransferase class I/II-fold pyridoxal phosphate-dependent enzyme [Sanguibacter antarcticus]PFG33598.1 DNA-binding transcriptional MocR family regulator [Sanguibacter antarcticus]